MTDTALQRDAQDLAYQNLNLAHRVERVVGWSEDHDYTKAKEETDSLDESLRAYARKLCGTLDLI